MERYVLPRSASPLVDASQFDVSSAGDRILATRKEMTTDEAGRAIPGLALRAKCREDLRLCIDLTGELGHTAQFKSAATSSGSFDGAGARKWLEEQGFEGLSTIALVGGGEFSQVDVDSRAGTVRVGPAVTFRNLRDVVPGAWSLTTNGANVTATLQNTGGIADGGEGSHSDLLAGTFMDASGVEHEEVVLEPALYHNHRNGGLIRPTQKTFDSVGRGGNFGASLDTVLPLAERAVRRSFVLVYHGNATRSEREDAHKKMLTHAVGMNQAALREGPAFQFRFGGLEGMDFRANRVAAISGNVFDFPDDTYAAVVVHTMDYRPNAKEDGAGDFLEKMADRGLLPEGLIDGSLEGVSYMDIGDLTKLELFRLAGPDEARKLIGSRVQGVDGREAVLNHSMSTDPGLNGLDLDQVLDVGMGIFNAQEDMLDPSSDRFDPAARPVMYVHLTGQQESPRVTIHGRVAMADREAFAAYKETYQDLVLKWQEEFLRTGRRFRAFAEKPFNAFSPFDRLLLARSLTVEEAVANAELQRQMDPLGRFRSRQVELWPGFIELVRENSLVTSRLAAK